MKLICYNRIIGNVFVRLIFSQKELLFGFNSYFTITDLYVEGKDRVDSFILDRTSIGEFINTLKYLKYCPLNRFIDDSTVVNYVGSGTIKGVIASTCKKDNGHTKISNPGVIFAESIISNKQSIGEMYNLLITESYSGSILKLPLYKGMQTMKSNML